MKVLNDNDFTEKVKSLIGDNNITKDELMIRKGNKSGETIAHALAKLDELPEKYMKDLEILNLTYGDKIYTPVANVLAVFSDKFVNLLNKDILKIRKTGGNGNTVAHDIAFNKIPEELLDESILRTKNDSGDSVARVLMEHSNLPFDTVRKYPDILLDKDSDGKYLYEVYFGGRLNIDEIFKYKDWDEVLFRAYVLSKVHKSPMNYLQFKKMFSDHNKEKLKKYLKFISSLNKGD